MSQLSHSFSAPKVKISELSSSRSRINTSWNSGLVTKTSTSNSAIKYSHSIAALSVDPTGTYVALGGKKGLYVATLDEWHLEPVKFVPPNKWELTTSIEWQPFMNSGLVASAANQNVALWDITVGTPITSTSHGVAGAHARALSDLAWSPFDNSLLATCSLDTNIHLWDIRCPDGKFSVQKTKTLKSFNGTAGAIKWNRHNPNLLASAHDGEVRIWDIRKETTPHIFILAHMSKINGIDWSYQREHDLITCSQDKQVKFWSITNPKVCKGTLQTGTPVLKARYLPIGEGLVTMAQRGDFSMRLWRPSDLSTPVYSFVGHTDVVCAFDWRLKSNESDSAAPPNLQLVSWSKDQHLRLWRFSSDHLRSLGLSLQVSMNELQAESSPSPTHLAESSASLSTSAPVLVITDVAGNTTSAAPTSGVIVPTIEHTFTPQNLKQEFAIVEKIPEIEIEESSDVNRMCIVLIRVKKHIIHLKITFPQHYPHNAAPSFEFLEKSTIPTKKKTKIRAILNQTAQDSVEKHKPCLEQCLLALLPEEEEQANSDEESDSSFSSISTPAVEPLKESIPCPRLSGVCFGPDGTLVYFFSNCKATPKLSSLRTYDELQQFSEEVDSISMRNSRTDARQLLSYNFTDTYFYPEDTTEADELSVFAESGNHNNQKEPPSPTIIPASKPSCSIRFILHFSHIDHFLPVTPVLAKLYSLRGASTSQICLANSIAAKQVGREDLVQSWSLFSLITDESVYPSNSKNNQALAKWLHHPMGRSLVASVFRHYEKLCDVQSLAMFSCVLASKSPTGLSFNIREAEAYMSPHLSGGVSLLSPQLEVSAQLYRAAYADLLQRWGELHIAAEILKYQRGVPQTSNRAGIEFYVVCKLCRRPLRSSYCYSCKVNGFSCSICRMVVKGMASFCIECGHGGHVHHMKEWFKEEEVCPTGCGCRCIH